jgi:hypothetical protein
MSVERLRCQRRLVFATRVCVAPPDTTVVPEGPLLT